MTDPTEDRLYQDPSLAQFYDLDNDWGPDLDYCASLAETASSVLDLGCGTGLFLASLVNGRTLVGVDPAAAMLDVARGRPGGDNVRWLQSDARTVRVGQKFDFVVLTGHAFQVFLTDPDQQAVLETIVSHLAPKGRFIFDTRNPSAVAWQDWTPEHSARRFQHPDLGMVEAWTDFDHDPASGVVAYHTHYRPAGGGEHYTASSKIRFVEQDHLARMLDEAGLHVDRWLGDWQDGACTADSPDFIPLGRRR